MATELKEQMNGHAVSAILAAAYSCKAPGEIGALLRREGIYSSQLETWRKQRATAARAALTP